MFYKLLFISTFVTTYLMDIVGSFSINPNNHNRFYYNSNNYLEGLNRDTRHIANNGHSQLRKNLLTEWDDIRWSKTESKTKNIRNSNSTLRKIPRQQKRAFLFPGPNGEMNLFIPNDEQNMSTYEEYKNERENALKQGKNRMNNLKSENFEVVYNDNFNFTNVGGYNNVKEELMQCSDLLINYEKYSQYNVRTPKGVILEGPPGNGKTLLAKGFSGQINASFISTSGSIFQEKYVGVGASRMRELFDLANKAKPCIIFIDEIDAIGRKRGMSDASSDSERDNTLNQLLTLLDGFDDTNGIFLMCATNRIDLLDSALLRPGRIDKKIYIGNPDRSTRKEIIDIHLINKPRDRKITMDMLLEMTNGLSGAEIENLLNEAMLKSLREQRFTMNHSDLEYVLSRTLVGFQANKNIFSPQMIERIAMHELGHGITGMLLTMHPKMTSINLNLWSPSSPGYTVFETEEIDANIFTKEKLIAHLIVLLSGRCAEQIFFNQSVTTGASKDFEEAYKLAERMITVYGMGYKTFYSSKSDKSKEMIDCEVTTLLEKAENKSKSIISESKHLFEYLKPLLIKDQTLRRDQIEKAINHNYPYILYKKYNVDL